MHTPLLQRLKKLLDSNSPFVVFRLPNSNQATVYYQENDQLHITKDLNCEGFLMAPFELKNQIPFIPSEFSEIHEVSKATLPVQNKSEPVLDSKNKDSFEKLVALAKQTIATGVLKKVVLSQTQEVVSKKSAVSIFYDLLSH